MQTLQENLSAAVGSSLALHDITALLQGCIRAALIQNYEAEIKQYASELLLQPNSYIRISCYLKCSGMYDDIISRRHREPTQQERATSCVNLPKPCHWSRFMVL